MGYNFSSMNPIIQQKHNVSIEGNVNAGKTLIFANGFGTNQTVWNWVKDDFKDNYRLILFDYAGSGNTDPDHYNPIKYNRLSTYADDLLTILADIDVTDAIVVAHSVSSMIVTLAAIKNPRHFSKLVFIGASPRYLDDSVNSYTGGFNQAVLSDMYATMNANYFTWATGFSDMVMNSPEMPELVEHFTYSLSAIRPDIALSVIRVIFESDVREELRQLNKEVLLLHAWDDIAVPEEVAYYLHENIKGSKLKFLNSKGHFPHITAPDTIVTAVKSFIGN
jgi:sigma-B regulation protein RsbQ